MKPQTIGSHVIKHKMLAVIGAMALTLVAMISVASAATLIANYSDFSDTSALQLNGDTTSPGSLLNLTQPAGGQSGSAFISTPINLANSASFSTDFSFRIHTNGGGGADGLAFVIQPHASNVGSGGGGLGYQGINNSLAIEFDTYDNGAVDGWNGSHVGISLNGNVDAVVQTNMPAQLDGGGIWYAWVDYDGTAEIVEVRISSTSTRPSSPTAALGNLNLQALLGVGNSPYAGFTAATGASSSDHEIHTWYMSNDIVNPVDTVTTITEVTETDGDGVPDDVDNCADAPNWDQADADNDGIGDVCDTPDGPGDPDDCEGDSECLCEFFDICEGDGGTKADILDNSGVEGNGVVERKAPGLNKEFNENSMATERAGKKK